jgi:NitT/TauT family transport system substrate-binding protein/taurine transport system substrate-binding protein
MAKGVPVQIVWNQERYTTDAGLVVKDSAGIKTPADLKGKTLAIVLGSQATFELAQYLQNSGVNPADVHQLNMSPQQMQSSWTTGAIDAALVWDPVFDYLSTHGGTVLRTDADLKPEASSYNICVANKDYAESHRQAAVGFVKALGDGVAYTQQNRQDALAIMAKQAGIDEATAAKELNGYQIYSLADQVTPAVLGNGPGVATSATGQSLLNNWKVLHDQGFLPTPPPSDVSQYINPSYAASALGGS